MHVGRMMVMAALGIGGTGALLAADPPPSDLPTVETACATCHGPAGQGNEARSAPRLAGLDANYIARQLRMFATGDRGAHAGDRFGSQMVVIARSLKPADIDALAAGYAARKPLPAAPAPDKPSDGSAVYAACAACHGEHGEGNADLAAPRIAGQAAWYVADQLRLFASGARGYARDDMAGQMMRAAVGQLDAKAQADVASYLATSGRPGGE